MCGSLDKSHPSSEASAFPLQRGADNGTSGTGLLRGSSERPEHTCGSGLHSRCVQSLQYGVAVVKDDATTNISKDVRDSYGSFLLLLHCPSLTSAHSVLLYCTLSPHMPNRSHITASGGQTAFLKAPPHNFRGARLRRSPPAAPSSLPLPFSALVGASPRPWPFLIPVLPMPLGDPIHPKVLDSSLQIDTSPNSLLSPSSTLQSPRPSTLTAG